MLATELANREASKRARLMRQARFPVPKSLDGYDFANVRLPDGYTKEQLTGLDFAAKAQDLVFYGKTGVERPTWPPPWACSPSNGAGA